MKNRSASSTMLAITSMMLLLVLIGSTWTAANSYGLEPYRVHLAPAIPTFEVVTVVVDQNVTIKTYNFPANDTFQVLMGRMGTRGVGGTLVDTIDSGSGGSFTKTFNIPEGLKGQKQVALRLQSTRSNYFSYGWFYNRTSSAVTVTGTVTGTVPAGQVGGSNPVLTIDRVESDKTVTIQIGNFPANETFTVRMGRMGTKGVNGYNVGTFNSGTGGAQTALFNIPIDLRGRDQISIRLESSNSSFYAFNWFNNIGSGTGAASESGYGGAYAPTLVRTPVPNRTVVPSHSFSITGVVKDTSVTIRTSNFRANDTYNVYMGKMGTRGVNGTLVGTFTSGTGGTQTGTFNIPEGLKGQKQIAIRLESPTSGYYAYNWFYNSTYP